MATNIVMAPIDYLMMDSMELARQIKEQEQERPEEQQPEIIRAAAVRHIPSGKFTEGFSHFDAALVAERRKDPNNYEVGFTTNRGRFVDRGEAHQIAKSANQIGKTEDEHLGAEDLGPDRFVPDTERKNLPEAATRKRPKRNFLKNLGTRGMQASTCPADSPRLHQAVQTM